MPNLNLNEISFVNDNRVRDLIISSKNWDSFLENTNQIGDIPDVKKIKGKQNI